MEAVPGINPSPAPVDLKSPEPEASKSFIKQVPSKRSSAFAAATLLGALTVMMLLALLIRTNLRRKLRTSAFCCPDVLQDLYSAANLTIDPCLSFFDHTCYAFVVAKNDISQRGDLNPDILEGYPKTEAGKAIAAYYLACVLSPEDTTAVGRDSAGAVVTASQLPKNASVTSYGLLTLLVDLSLQYGLPSVIEFSIGTSENRVLCVNISASKLVNMTGDLSSDVADALKRDAVKTVNEALSYDVSGKDMDKFLSEVTKSMSVAFEEYSLGSIAKFIPDISTEQWKEVMAKFITDRNVLFRVSKQVLEDTLSLVFKTKNRQIVIVSALVQASVKLASRLMIDVYNSEAKKYICRSRAKRLRPLWILDSVEPLKSDLHDAAIRKAYGMVTDTILQNVRSVMEADDFRKLNTTVKEMRLLLPSKIVPGELTVPNLTSVYADAELATQAYLLEVQRYWMFTLTASEDLLEDFEKRHVVINGNVLTVPTSVYSIHSFTNATESMLLMSTVGVHLADSLWRLIFASKLSVATNETLHAYHDCIIKNSWPLIEWPSGLLWPSVQTSLEASKDVDWDSLVDTSLPLRVTHRQLFYMIFVRYAMCESPHRNYPMLRRDVDVSLTGLKDFSQSFDCDVTVSKTKDMCKL